MSAALVNYSRDEAILRADELYHQINRYPVHEHRYLVQHVERDDFAEVVGPQLIECLCGAILLELGCTRVGTTIPNAGALTPCDVSDLTRTHRQAKEGMNAFQRLSRLR